MTEHSNRGFTLVEVVVVVALMGLVAAVVAATVTVVVKNLAGEGAINRSATSARALRGLDTWLSYDIVGVSPGGFDLSAGSASWCTGAAAGTNLVQLTWSGADASQRVAAYRVEDDTTGKLIRRYTCHGTAGPPFGNTSSVVVARDLTSTPPTATPITEVGSTVGVTVLAETTGGPVTVTALSRHSPTTVPPPPTTEAPTPPPCTVLATNLDPPPSALNGSGNPSPLTNSFALNFTFGGTCESTLKIQFDRGDGIVRTQTLSGTYPDYATALSNNSSELWYDGPHVIIVFNGSVALTPTYTFTVN